MTLKKAFLSGIVILSCLLLTTGYTQPVGGGIGQTIQIYTHFRNIVGKPSWLLELRDIDTNQNLPYVFDITRRDNFWLAMTYGRNYLVIASTMQIITYQPRTNEFRKHVIRDFCHLESNGRILRGESLYVTVGGDLTPNSNTYTCHVSSFANSNFSIAEPSTE